ncbi:TITAN-like protein isoform X1 [Senna tora]|uniref:TITAN-like protein isoform X1 n=1 Tax=Senna tora TaxID=362788 RepID=A0A835C732_9FABA|nr:TITAN-like protein isoform X1 [Senna tora]
MGEQLNSKESNPKIESKKQGGINSCTKKNSEFEFCKVCNLNHNQGLRHKYFPNHKKSLSTFLSRFHKKVSDIRFFLKNPISLRSEHASRNRFWCVFCDADVEELASSFACANAINHLASVNHLKNLKHFFWKYGGAMDKLETFTVSDADVAKWEKKCMNLQEEAVSSSEKCHGAEVRPSSDIHNQLNYGNIDKFDISYSHSHSVKSHPSNGVLPLQYYTNEYQVSNSEISSVRNACPISHDNTYSRHLETCSGADSFNSKDFAVEMSCRALPCSGRQWSSDGCSSSQGVSKDGTMLSTESSYQGVQVLTQITSVLTENPGGNVHSGAPPPWFEATEGIQINAKPISGDLVSSLNKSGNSKKLNPKRVGAAWAEKRKIEMEMEKRGETVNQCDANWLPNFGRVWQSGSRKESRKEFEREKQKLFKLEVEPEIPIKIQPYVSKRMRMDTNGGHTSGILRNWSDISYSATISLWTSTSSHHRGTPKKTISLCIFGLVGAQVEFCLASLSSWVILQEDGVTCCIHRREGKILWLKPEYKETSLRIQFQVHVGQLYCVEDLEKDQTSHGKKMK